MKKVLFTFIVLVGLQSLLYSQELKRVSFENSEVYVSGLTLSQNWITKLDLNTIQIYNGNIKNSSTKVYRDLVLSLYLMPSGNRVENGTFQGYLTAESNFAKLEGNSSLVGVNIKSEVLQTPPDGMYNPLLVLTNKSGKVLGFKVVTDSMIKAEQGVVSIPSSKSPADTKPVYNFEPVVVNVDHDKSLSLDKDWKIEINFKDAHVSILGGDISNWTDKNQDDITIDVFLTDKPINNVSTSFNGVKIASANIGTIESYKRFEGTDVTAGLINIPKNGSYYILLTLSSKDKDGGQTIRAERLLDNQISF